MMISIAVNKIENIVNRAGALPVMEHFYTLQGEGFHWGKAAYFIRWVAAMWAACGAM
jgi:hypothetical protein